MKRVGIFIGYFGKWNGIVIRGIYMFLWWWDFFFFLKKDLGGNGSGYFWLFSGVILDWKVNLGFCMGRKDEFRKWDILR